MAKPIICLSLFLSILTSCNIQSDNRPSVSRGIADTLKNSFAMGFEIIRCENFTQLSVFNPWQNAGDVKIKYILTQGDKKFYKPTDIEFIIKTPVRKAICLSTTHISFIGSLDELGKIKGISGKTLINNEIIRRGIERGVIQDVGYEKNLNYEAVAAIRPDVIFAYGVESDINGYVNKFKELGVPVVLIGEYLETHPLAKTEWIKVFGEFFNKQEKAVKLFDSISSVYFQLKNYTLEIKNRPTVISSIPWNGTWFISGSKSYLATLIGDAGGNYIWGNLDTRESKPIDFEIVFSNSENADFWINPGSAEDLRYISNIDKRLTRLKPFKTGKIFNNNARINQQGGNDYWESGTMNPHLILHDLISIFHPELDTGHELFYYRQLE